MSLPEPAVSVDVGLNPMFDFSWALPINVQQPQTSTNDANQESRDKTKVVLEHIVITSVLLRTRQNPKT